MPKVPPTEVLRTEPLLASGGDAVAKNSEGKVVFVRGAAPDERVLATITNDNKRFARAVVSEVVEASPNRVAAACPVVDRCGGCSLQHVDAAAQLASKHAAVIELIRRVGKVDVDAIEVAAPWSGAPYGYRTRAKLQVHRNFVGYYEERTHNVVDAGDCPILAPPLLDAVTRIRAAVRGNKSRGAINLVTDGTTVMASTTGGLEGALRQVDGLRVEKVPGAGFLGADAHGAQFLSPSVFSQANLHGNEAVLSELERLLPEKIEGVLELYAGSGNLTRVLATHADNVLAVEASAPATGLAERLAVHLQWRHVTRRAVSVETLFESPPGQFDLIVANPPRTGLATGCASAIAACAPQAMLYLSCDPGTFAKDAQKLQAHGLQLRQVRTFDLYPQTAHCEVLGLFRNLLVA